MYEDGRYYIDVLDQAFRSEQVGVIMCGGAPALTAAGRRV